MSNFRWNKDAGHQIEHLAKDAIRAKAQPVFDRLSRECKGKPLDEVKSKVAREWKRATGGTITDPELTQYAIAFSEGRRVLLR